ncbi:MAG: hypothetical protein FWD69_08780 [Polyangiaceae bacterium]|nr:hypothetical protein [Polyangiaceae bacterium]
MRTFVRAVVSGTFAALAVVTAIALSSPLASAKSGFDSSYGFDRTWNAGMRLVRVDLGLKVTEKDDVVGYLLFDYKSPESGAKAVPASMEFIRAKDGGSVRVVVQIPKMPGYHEQVLVDQLARKLRSEYGDPPKTPPVSPPRDAGADGDVDGGEGS